MGTEIQSDREAGRWRDRDEGTRSAQQFTFFVFLFREIGDEKRRGRGRWGGEKVGLSQGVPLYDQGSSTQRTSRVSVFFDNVHGAKTETIDSQPKS